MLTQDYCEKPIITAILLGSFWLSWKLISDSIIILDLMFTKYDENNIYHYIK